VDQLLGLRRAADRRVRASVYVMWQEQRSGECEIYFNRSLDAGASWLPENLRLDLPRGTGAGSARMAASGSSVYVTWPDRDLGATSNDIYFNRSLDGGSTWLPSPVRLDVGTSSGTSSSSMPAIAADGSSVYVAWVDDRDGGGGDIYFNRSLDAGTSWLPQDVRLSSPPTIR
jgi:hypothetical protein